MKNKWIIICVAVIIIIIATIVGLANENKNSYTIEGDDYLTLYEHFIDDIIKQSSSLNKNMIYISLDMDSFKNLDDNEKYKLIEYVSKYNENVLTYSYKELEDNGYIINDSLEGILIQILDYNEHWNKTEISIYKYKTSLGSVGQTYEVKQRNNKWIIKPTVSVIS